jgi:formylglycine-generating enzyme required for sulfatase activity
LHDVHGNVWEWCLNRPYDYGTEPGSQPSTYLVRTCRGGGKRSPALFARSALRQPAPLELRAADVGLRPARPIDP